MSISDGAGVVADADAEPRLLMLMDGVLPVKSMGSGGFSSIAQVSAGGSGAQCALCPERSQRALGIVV